MAAVRDWRIPKASKETIVREEHHHTETKSESIPPEILERFSAMEQRYIDQEKALQVLVQALDGMLRRIENIEAAMLALSNAAEERLKEAS